MASSQPAPAAKRFNELVDQGTANVCGDFHDEGRTINTEPARKRAIVRLVVVLVIAGLTTWAVEWIAMNHKGTRDYKTLSKEPLTYANKNFPPLPAGSILSASNQSSPNFTCPCIDPPTFTWCKFINFYLIENSNQLTVTPISLTNNDCKHPPNLDHICQSYEGSDFQSCSDALASLFNFIDTQTYIETDNLVSPLKLHTLVSAQMRGNIYTKNQSTINLNSSFNQNNQSTKQDYSLLVLLLLESMVLQEFDCNTNSSMQEFWERGNICGWNYYPQIASKFKGPKFAFGMAVDYSAYSNLCKPEACYAFQEENFNTRLMNALTEVGGVGSLILLGIRLLVWPLVAKIFSFPGVPSPGLSDGQQLATNIWNDCCN